MSFRLAVLALVVVFFGSVARADDKERSNRSLIGNGAAMLTVGLISMVVGGALLATSTQRANDPSCGGGCSDDTTAGAGAGVALLSVGAVHAAAGIPLVAVGGAREARRREAMTLSAAVSPASSGATAALALRW